MNIDAGTEDFFWREIDQEEEKEAKRLLREQAEYNRQQFIDKLREQEEKRRRRER